jgi:hypothetical protein
MQFVAAALGRVQNLLDIGICEIWIKSRTIPKPASLPPHLSAE